jgi:hypothetical protein
VSAFPLDTAFVDVGVFSGQSAVHRMLHHGTYWLRVRFEETGFTPSSFAGASASADYTAPTLFTLEQTDPANAAANTIAGMALGAGQISNPWGLRDHDDRQRRPACAARAKVARMLYYEGGRGAGPNLPPGNSDDHGFMFTPSAPYAWGQHIYFNAPFRLSSTDRTGTVDPNRNPIHARKLWRLKIDPHVNQSDCVIHVSDGELRGTMDNWDAAGNATGRYTYDDEFFGGDPDPETINGHAFPADDVAYLLTVHLKVSSAYGVADGLWEFWLNNDPSTRTAITNALVYWADAGSPNAGAPSMFTGQQLTIPLGAELYEDLRYWGDLRASSAPIAPWIGQSGWVVTVDNEM